MGKDHVFKGCIPAIMTPCNSKGKPDFDALVIKAKQLILTDHPVVLTGDPSSDIQNIPDWIISWLRSNFLRQNTTTKCNKN